MSESHSRPLVLVVEDDRDIREALVELLATFGYLAQAANHGAEAMLFLEASAALPALIVLDLMMPVMDGYAFHERLRNNPAWAAIPVLVLSADLTARARLPGSVEVLRKPAGMNEFMSAVEKLVPPP